MKHLFVSVLMAVIICVAPVAVWAGEERHGDTETTPPPPPDDPKPGSSESRTDPILAFDPCNVDAGDGGPTTPVYDQCVSGQLNLQDNVAKVVDCEDCPLTWEITTDDLDEPDQLCTWETAPSIRYTYVEINRPGLVAKIRKFDESPGATHLVRIWLNDTLITFASLASDLPADLNARMQTAIANAGFIVESCGGEVGEEFLVVSYDLVQKTAPTSVGIFVADETLEVSAISLEPGNEFCSSAMEMLCQP